jgi:hypothetical protein
MNKLMSYSYCINTRPDFGLKVCLTINRASFLMVNLQTKFRTVTLNIHFHERPSKIYIHLKNILQVQPNI